MHVPIETAREARDEARRLGADCAVAIGGGSTTGLGKAIALDSGLPILATATEGAVHLQASFEPLLPCGDVAALADALTRLQPGQRHG